LLTRVLTLHDPLPGNRPVYFACFRFYPQINVPVFHGHHDCIGFFLGGTRDPSERDSLGEATIGLLGIHGHIALVWELGGWCLDMGGVLV
jgi:hypothetical protein